MPRIRTTTSTVLSAILLPVGIVSAVTLVIIAHVGGFDVAVFVMVFTVLTVAALSSLEFGILALITAASLDGFLKGLSPGWHTQLLKDYILAICILRWGWLSVLGHRRKSMWHPMGVPIIFFVMWCIVQLLNARNASLIMALAGLRVWIIWLPVFFLTYDYMRSRKHVERFLIFIIVLMIPLTAYGILQYHIGFDHLFNLGPGFDVYKKAQYATPEYKVELRPPSTFISPHGFAGSAVMALLLCVGAMAYFRDRRALQGLAVVGMPLLVIALLITAVRNAYGSAAAAVLVLLGLIRQPGLVLLAVLVGYVAVWQVDQITGGAALERLNTVFTQPRRTQHRIMAQWGKAVHWWPNYPLGGGIATGAGRGRMLYSTVSVHDLAPESRTPWAENEYARCLIELGIPGFLLYLWMLFTAMRLAFQSYRVAQQARDRWLLAAILAACTSMLLRLLVGAALYGWPEAILFWCYVAIAMRLPEIEAEEQGVHAPTREAALQALRQSG